MKILKFTAILAFLTISMNVKAQFAKADVQVSGLTCSMCQLATQKALKTLDFVSDIKPDLNKNIYVITFKKDKKVDLDLIRKKVKDAGFSVSKLVATLNLNKVAITNNFHYSLGGDIYHFMNVPDRTLSGDVRLTVINNGFIPAGDYKKYASQTTYACYKTGKMDGKRVFHVTI